MDLFVMVTDWDLDRVDDPNAHGLTETQRSGCIDAAVICGALGRKYPDAKAMGIIIITINIVLKSNVIIHYFFKKVSHSIDFQQMIPVLDLLQQW
jgi:hypothetical protein